MTLPWTRLIRKTMHADAHVAICVIYYVQKTHLHTLLYNLVPLLRLRSPLTPK